MPRRKNNDTPKSNNALPLPSIRPLTKTQEEVFSQYDAGANLLLHGVAGTGKTFLAMYLALGDVVNTRQYQKVVIVRSVVPTRDMGFLPGNQKEKQRVYEQPYSAIATELFGRGDAYEILKSKVLIDFISTSFVRGVTFNDAVVIVDECQNMTFHELDSVITRIGKNCKIIFSGDYRQSDLTRDVEKNGLKQFMDVLGTIPDFATIEFTEDDIVRSKLVKSYIIAKLRKGLT